MKGVDFLCAPPHLSNFTGKGMRLDWDWLVLILSSLKLIYCRGKKLFIRVGFHFRTVYHTSCLNASCTNRRRGGRCKTKKKSTCSVFLNLNNLTCQMGFSCRFGYGFPVSIWLIHPLLCCFFLKRTISYITYFITLLLLDGAIAQGLVLMQIRWLQLPEFSLVKLISFLRKEDFFFLKRLFSESFLQRHKSVARHCWREQLLWVVVCVSRPSERRWRASDITVSKKKNTVFGNYMKPDKVVFSNVLTLEPVLHTCAVSVCAISVRKRQLCAHSKQKTNCHCHCINAPQVSAAHAWVESPSPLFAFHV